MTKSIPNITLSASRDIPFDKLVLSQANVRRIKSGVSIEELAEDIARRTLLQSLTVRAVLDGEGCETGMFEIPAGGRRYRALELLVRQKRLAKNAPVPCVVRYGGVAEEDSLAENIQRAPLHPLDQFRAFLALREKGQSEEEIAAAFFVSVAVVRQRLRLAAVSPRLLDVYAEDGLTLDQLMAFTVNGDHERQEQVFDRLSASYLREPYTTRRMLTEGAVRASDKRAQFVAEAYAAEGGGVMRDLFQGDDGGWLQDVALVDRLVAERLTREAEGVRAEGWKWIEVAPDFPYGHTFGLRQLRGESVPLTAEQEATRDALDAEKASLEDSCAALDEIPQEIDQRLAEIETALAALDDGPARYDPADLARAGAFVSIDPGGRLRVERGYLRPEDEEPAEEELAPEVPSALVGAEGPPQPEDAAPAEPEEDEGLQPISDRVMAELTTHRTLALREAVGSRWDVAFLAALHVFCLNVFYRFSLDSCLDLDLKSVTLNAQTPGLADAPAARELLLRHRAWAMTIPKDPRDLWDTLRACEEETRQALFAHCVSLSVNAVQESWNRRPGSQVHANRLAQAVDLDMAAAGWKPTVENFLGRVTKARILGAVREARGDAAALRLEPLKKAAMAQRAEDLLAGTGWLPEPLRTPGRSIALAKSTTNLEAETGAAADPAVEATPITGGEPAVGSEYAQAESEPAEHALAAE